MLYNDNVAELDESVYIELVNPTGGARLGRSSDGNDFNVSLLLDIRTACCINDMISVFV